MNVTSFKKKKKSKVNVNSKEMNKKNIQGKID